MRKRPELVTREELDLRCPDCGGPLWNAWWERSDTGEPASSFVRPDDTKLYQASKCGCRPPEVDRHKLNPNRIDQPFDQIGMGHGEELIVPLHYSQDDNRRVEAVISEADELIAKAREEIYREICEHFRSRFTTNPGNSQK